MFSAYKGKYFKVEICKAWLENKCDLREDECFFSHAAHPERRLPLLLSGNWNYRPEMCAFSAKCAKGDRCRFSHSVYEQRFHPLVYKTTLCKSRVNEEGVCLTNGQLCGQAHHKNELRRPPKMQPPKPKCQIEESSHAHNQYVVSTYRQLKVQTPKHEHIKQNRQTEPQMMNFLLAK